MLAPFCLNCGIFVEVCGFEVAKWKLKWKSCLWYHYNTKAHSCEQALGVVCGNVASETKK
jgi:hypothetical protein